MLLSLSMTECRFSVVAGKGQPFYCNCQNTHEGETEIPRHGTSSHKSEQHHPRDTRTCLHRSRLLPHNTYRHHSNAIQPLCLKVIGDNLTATLTRDRLIETKRKSQTQFNLHVGSHDFTKFNFTHLQQSANHARTFRTTEANMLLLCIQR